MIAIASLSPLVQAWYFRRRALAGDPQLTTLRRWILAYSSWSGTDFRDADLTGANFFGASLRFAGLAHPRDLARTRLRGARDLHLAHVKGTILADRRVRDLLVSGAGEGLDLEHADLHGACLAGASLRKARLADAQLTGADLSGADLTDADLSRAVLIGADLTGATLTGALLDGWNIDTATRLDGVRADFCYLEAGPDGTRRERRPQDEDLFGPGDFTTLFQQALKTVDLIFRGGIDWDAFRAALDALRAHHAQAGDGRESEVRVRSIESTDDGRLIVRIAVPDEADKDADYRRIGAEYEARLTRLMAERDGLQARIEHKDELLAEVRRHSASLERMIDATICQQSRADPPRLSINNVLHNSPQTSQETTQMSTSPSVTKTVTQTGNFSGSNINIDARLEQVTQSIATLANTAEDTREQLTELVRQLETALAQLPAERAADADAVWEFTSDLIGKAAQNKGPSVLRIAAGNLLDAARGLADKAAPVVKLVEQILGLLGLH